MKNVENIRDGICGCCITGCGQHFAFDLFITQTVTTRVEKQTERGNQGTKQQ